METKKQHSRVNTSKLCSTRRPRGAKALNIFDHDLDNRALYNLSHKETLAIDTETGGLDYRQHKLLLVQIATDNGRVYMIRRPTATSFRLATLLSCPYSSKIFHNAAFDLRFIKAYLRKEVDGRIDCTKTLMKIVHPDISSGLGNSLQKIIKVTIDKKKIEHGHWDDEELSRDQVEYAAYDVLYLHKLLRKLREDAKYGDLLKYREAMEAIVKMVHLQVEGYTDLFDYPQNKFALTLQQRNWWNTGNQLHVKHINCT